MKKSDLHKHIKETILSKLSENYKDKIGDSNQKQDMEESATEDDVESQKKYNDELERTNQLQKDMGMAESKKKA